ncbi:helix-turn-helix domain-containing protein [Cohnella silvisoli]|uniref:Helix-turn-helix domain-containing protein n=1 Tax=Cohnella silvisoli TaxID=2873699 RepID=A0ABV1L366_9BACL|nr:helix-turn-helix domain-containing protein [Cohnella silvisoli]MCD9026015.1 helix-turn-helix domain-containing protein [Cohnella silvisoli]
MTTYELRDNLSVPEAAAYLNMGETKLKAVVKTGELKSYKNGRLRRIKREWLLEYEARLITSSNEREREQVAQ